MIHVQYLTELHTERYGVKLLTKFLYTRCIQALHVHFGNFRNRLFFITKKVSVKPWGVFHCSYLLQNFTQVLNT
jgi:hypothetical protein